MGQPPRPRLHDRPRAARHLGRILRPTTVHLVRHAAHGLLPHTLAGRMPGVPLSGEGQAQAMALATWFAGHPVTTLVSSPVQRAQETAAPIAARLALPVRTDPAWTEIDFGTWTGRRFDALALDPAWTRWNHLRALATPPDGEPMHAAQSRALAALDRLRAAHPGQSVVVVSHADILKSVLAAALGLGLDHLHRFRLDPASISTLTLFDDTVEVASLNHRLAPSPT